MAFFPVVPIYNINQPIVHVLRQRRYRARESPLIELQDEDFFSRYRFSKQNFRRLLHLFDDDIKHPTARSDALSSELQLCIALRFYASGSFLEVIGDTANVHKSTVCRVVDSVSNMLCRRLDEFVYFPENLQQVKEDFFQVAGMAGIVGVVDGTHIRIIAPSGDQEPLYVNRKNYHSINAQVICDNKNRILDLVADWPGSVHDSRVFTTSHVGVEFADGRIDGILLGDSGYGCTNYLLTPMLNPETQQQRSYTAAHVSTRSVIERTIGKPTLINLNRIRANIFH